MTTIDPLRIVTVIVIHMVEVAYLPCEELEIPVRQDPQGKPVRITAPAKFMQG